MDASQRGVLLNNLASLMERDQAYLAVKMFIRYIHVHSLYVHSLRIPFHSCINIDKKLKIYVLGFRNFRQWKTLFSGV